MTQAEVQRLLNELHRAETGTIILEPQSSFNGGIVGFDGQRLIYDYFKTIMSMLEEFGGEEGALDWFSYNTLRSLPYMGSEAPIIWNSEHQEVMYPDDEAVEIECYLGLQNSLKQVNYKENNGDRHGNE